MLQRANVAEVLKAEGQRDRQRRLTRIVAFIAVLVVLAAGAILLWSVWRGATTVAYTTDPVGRGDIAVVLTATGTLEPTQRVSVSSLVTGTIASIDVDYNQPVSKGQILARLELVEFDLRLKRAMAMVDAQAAAKEIAAAGLSDAEAALRRINGLSAGQVVSVEQVELATTARRRARANLAAAVAQLEAAQTDLAAAESDHDKAIIVAPIDGMVLDVNAEIGQTINSTALAASLFTIASDLRRLELEVDVDEADVAQLKVGDVASFTVEAMPDQPLAGVVRQIRTGPTVSDGITSYKAVIAVDNTSLLLRPGMTATADITTATAKNVLTVSNAALRFEPTAAPRLDTTGDQRHVYVLANGKPEPVALTTGLSDGQRSEVSSGDLAVGDPVVIGAKGR